MKKIILVVGILISSFAQAQQELKVDIADALVMKTLDLSYEYYLSDQSSVGIAALFNFEKKTASFRYNENQMFTPYFRHYFSNSRNWNYFGEVFMGINTGEKEITIDGVATTKKYTDGALGIAAGTKYVSNGGFLIEIFGGLGRNMFTSDSYAIVPRVGVNVGYQF